MRRSNMRINGLRITCCLLTLAATAVSFSDITVAQTFDSQPLKVFILAGQSNMQGHAHVRTIDAMRLNPAAAPLLKQIRNADGTNYVCKNVWISSIGSADEEQTGQLTTGFGAKPGGPKIGPELMFGITMEQRVKNPILIIKTAWGGKSLNTDFRPPGAGPFRFNETQLDLFRRQNKDIPALKAEKAAASGHYYRLMIEHVRNVLGDIQRVYPNFDAEQGYELAGFVWFQGWNDMVDRGTYPDRDRTGGYDEYSRLLAQFIRDVRKDLSAPKLPFAIGVMGVGGPTTMYGPEQQRYQSIHQNFRDAMAAPASLPEFKGNVTTVLTEKFWDMQLVSLRAKEKTIKPQIEAIRNSAEADSKQSSVAEKAIENLYKETFTQSELEVLQDSTSNFEFHYLGSAGIMAQIGKSFAEAFFHTSK